MPRKDAKLSLARKDLGIAASKSVRELLSSQNCVVAQNGDLSEVEVIIAPQHAVVLKCD